MKTLSYVIIPLVILVLVAGMAGCSSGGGSSTPTPTATSTVTASPTPASNATTAPRSTIVLRRTMSTPTATPTPRYRGILPVKTDTTNLSLLVRSTAVSQNVSGYKLIEAVRSVPRVSAIVANASFDDSNDFSMLEFALSASELYEFSIVSKIDITALPTPAPTFPAGAPKPYYDIRVQVILCANDDGSGGAASSAAMTADYFTKVINSVNNIFDDAGMRLVYNPVTDFVRMNSTLLNLDFTVPSNINYYSPSYNPPINESYMKTLKQPHDDMRQSVARGYRGKMVLLLCDGNELVYNGSSSRWEIIGRTFAFSGEDWEFVALPPWQGDVQAWANLLAHESGHYYHQWHPQVEVKLTAAEEGSKSLTDANKAAILKSRAESWVKSYIDQGHAVSDGLNVFDADISQVSDTPPDPGPQFWYYLTGNDCGIIDEVHLDVPLQSTTMPYTLEPDRGNVVSYFKHCTNILQHYSAQQIAGMRKSLTDENRWHLIGTPMRLVELDTHVQNDQVYYNAVWQPGTSNDVAVFGWAYDDFLTKAGDMLNSGWTMKLLNSFVLNGQVYYDAVWQSGATDDYAVLGWASADFYAKADEMRNGGWRLKLLDTHVIDNQVYYNAVWQHVAPNDVTVFGWAYDDFVAKSTDMLNSGWTMKLLNSFVLNGQVYYDALWQSGATDDYAVLGWATADFYAKANEMRSNAWRLKLLDTHVINNQVYYNAVWQHVAPNDIAIYGWAFADFNKEYGKLW